MPPPQKTKYELGAAPDCMLYLAVASTEYQKDNQLRLGIPCINLHKK